MWDNLEDDMVGEILCRLPVKTLLRAECVCPNWCRVIKDPTFTSLLHRQGNNNQVVFCNPKGKSLYTSSLESVIHSGGDTSAAFLKAIRSHMSKIHMPKPSCHGLMLLKNVRRMEDYYYLWNPFTGESRKLPTYEDVRVSEYFYHEYPGLGHDITSQDFKVVVHGRQMHSDRFNLVEMTETLVYSLKLNNWRRLKGPVDFPVAGHGAFLNGALHWITSKYDEEMQMQIKWIMAFDVGLETYRLLPSPPGLSEMCSITARSIPPRANITIDMVMELDVLDSFLFLSFSYRGRFILWIMKDYGGENLWTELLSLENLPYYFNGLGYHRPRAYLKSKDQVLVQTHRTEFLWFDVVEKRPLKKVDILRGCEGKFSCQVIEASLARIPYGGGGGGGNVGEQEVGAEANVGLLAAEVNREMVAAEVNVGLLAAEVNREMVATEVNVGAEVNREIVAAEVNIELLDAEVNQEMVAAEVNKEIVATEVNVGAEVNREMVATEVNVGAEVNREIVAAEVNVGLAAAEVNREIVAAEVNAGLAAARRERRKRMKLASVVAEGNREMVAARRKRMKPALALRITDV